MDKLVTDIVSDVKVAIDEQDLNGSEFDGLQDNSEMTKIIESKIEDALTYIYTNADTSLLEDGCDVFAGDGENGKVATIVLKKNSRDYNLLRLVAAKCDSWVRAVGNDELIRYTDKAYDMLKDKYTTGTRERPKVALVRQPYRPVGSSVYKMCWTLELYTPHCDEEETDGYYALCLEEPTKRDDGYNIPEKVYRACVYYIAGMTLLTYREAQAAELMFQQAQAMMSFPQKEKSQPVVVPQPVQADTTEVQNG